MNVLVVNVGSSSVKLDVVDEDGAALARRELHGSDDVDGVRRFTEVAPDYAAVGHRIVHGGPDFTTATAIDATTFSALERLAGLAPLHNPPALRLLAAMRSWDQRPHVACFDTTFHATMPDAARTYAVPRAWRDRGVRRFGFHGLSHAYAARQVTEQLGLPASSARVVSCHLGAGASVAAIVGGRSVDTSMGFTPVEGLVMASRSGDVDPGALAWLLGTGAVDVDTVEQVLDRESGLVALAGTADMRALVDRDDPDAETAVAVYVHRLVRYIGAMAAATEGLDALVFTGGVGERSPAIRARACAPLAFLGVDLDPEANLSATECADLSRPGASARVAVVHAREDVEIARQVRDLLRG